MSSLLHGGGPAINRELEKQNITSTALNGISSNK